MRPEAIILLAAGAAVLALAQGIYYVVLYLGQRQRAELRRRLRDIATPQADPAGLGRERRLARSPGLERLLRPLPFVERLEKLLAQTDLTWTVATVMVLCLLSAMLFAAVLALLLRRWPLLALGGIPVGFAVPPLLVLNARSRRMLKISEQLPDALDMMVRSLRAGHGIANGFKLVAQEMRPPVAVEFGRVFEEQQFGVDLRQALTHMTERVPKNLDLKIFSVSLIIQRETGGNLVEILDQIGNTLRERFKFYGKLRSLTAEGRLSGYILGALPFVCFGMVTLINPTYLGPLITERMGHLIGVGGLVMWALGVLWMSKIVKVDY